MLSVRSKFALTTMACLPMLVSAATLERLSMDDMVQKSTAIVRGRIIGSSASFRGLPGKSVTIYTHYIIQVAESWKGALSGQVDVAVPGGLANGIRQTFAGAPVLDSNADYVLFLWTSRTGLTQIIGLSQGLMSLKLDASGNSVLGRGPSSEPMVDNTGKAVADKGFSMSLSDFRAMMRGYGMVSSK